MITKILNYKLIKTVGLPLFLLTFSFIIRFIALLQTKYGNGWDAYFYLEQIKAIITEGKMHSKDVSLIYPYLLFFKFIISDYILAYKIAIALLSGFFVLSLFYLAKNILSEKYRYINALLISLFVIYSPTITYIASQFPKNLMGLVFFNFFLIFWFKEKRWQMVLFFLFTFLTHRLTAGVICIFIITELIINRKYLLLFLLISAAFLLSLILPGTIHLYDIERFNQIFTHKIQFAPISFIQIMSYEKIGSYWLLEMIISQVILVFTIISLLFYKQKISLIYKKLYLSLIFISIILLFPFYKFDINGPALRFFIVFLCIAPIFLLFIIEKLNITLKYILTLLLLIGALFSYHTYNPIKIDPPYQIYSKITEKTCKLLKDKNYEIIVAHKALAEYFSFSTNNDALPWQPENTYNLNKIWRISAGVSYNDFKYYFSDSTTDSIQKLGIDYFLLPETLWQRFIKQIKLKDDLNLMKIVFSDKNPNQIRPKYLMKGKKI